MSILAMLACICVIETSDSRSLKLAESQKPNQNEKVICWTAATYKLVGLIKGALLESVVRTRAL
jgi:hypothetical protein